jgi:glyoxylase-like metal-dependent hydrolase (beta-lactamase superfamily II)
MWVPTSATLQQLERASSVDEMRRRITPGPLGAVEIELIAPDVVRIVMPAGGGVPGQPVCAYLVGRRRLVLFDPGDPTGEGLDRAFALAADRGGSIEAVAITQADPDHAGGAEAAAEIAEVGIVGGPGAGRSVPYAVRELADLEWLDVGDVPIRAIHTPGPTVEHVAFLVGDEAGPRFVIAGDLDGRRGARAITVPADEVAIARSRERLDQLAPDATRLYGHPARRDPG